MRYRLRTLLIVLAILLFAGGAYTLYAFFWRTTIVVPLPYEQAEARLFSALGMSREALVTTGVAQSDVKGELQKSLRMGIHTHHLLQHVPERRVHFWGDHAYNIWGSGRERIEFDLASAGENRSTITVDYFEYSWFLGFLPTSCQSGRQQERHIVATIFGDKLRQ
ncbi:MAG TPA: hypothetical protein VFV87_20030 [Pirellulaceae bacterium]|nr:hypothetical protein [Pirellulaceae bacterium]